MGSDCSKLGKDHDGCNIMNCVESMTTTTGAKGASDSIVWVLKMNHGVKYDDVEIHDIIMKWGASPRWTGFTMDDYGITKGIEYPLAIEYETKVYKQLISPILDNKMCPNFIRYLGDGTDCSFDQITARVVNKENVKKQIRQITGKNTLPDKYNILLLEKSKGNSLFTLATQKNSGKISGKPEFWKLMFQMFVACRAMSLVKLTHQDLHPNNTLVESRESRDMYYSQTFKGGEKISVKLPGQKWIAKIYDFDRAYSELLGDNGLFDIIDMDGQENKFFSIKDMLRIICSFNQLNVIPLSESLNLFTDDMVVKRRLTDIMNQQKQKCWFSDDDGWINSNYELFGTVDDAMKRMIKKLVSLTDASVVVDVPEDSDKYHLNYNDFSQHDK
jgi:hypothetical protein